MLLALVVSAAAGFGAVARYVLDQLVQHRTAGEFPAGTMVVNVSGSLVLGLVVGLSLHHGLSNDAALVVGSGLLGGYTTLSTWAYETWALGESGAWAEAAVNVAGSFAAGLAAAALGLWLGSLSG